MRKIKATLVLILMLSIGLFSFQRDVVEAIVAVVGDDIITLSEIRSEYRLRADAIRAQLQGEQLAAQMKSLKQNLLDELITNKLLLQKAENQGIDVTEQMNMQIENIKNESGFESDEQLIQAMRQQGIIFEDWKTQMEENLLRQAVIFNEVGQSIVVDDTEVVNYYQEHRQEFTEPAEYTLKAIYLSGENKIREEVQSTMDEIQGKLQSGREFGSLAEEYSDLEQTEDNQEESQGLLGNYRPGELNPDLEEAVQNLNVGEVSSWIEAQNGWWLIKLADKKEPRVKEFQEVRDEIERSLYQQKQQTAVQKYLKKLRESSYVKVIIENPLDY